MVQWTWPVSASPGTEQANRWGSAAADRQGSLNYAGAKLPAIDGAIQAMLSARAREDFVAAARVLDRLVMSGHFVVPLFVLPDLWVAHHAERQLTALELPDTADAASSQTRTGSRRHRT
ncbi:MAG: hypothetical protein NTU50_07830 [Actinobacteria bacterium]|nr:hypothetical protein [Actinomycetota bacterium]